jgi:restriction system protein
VIHHSQYTYCPQEPREVLIEFIDAIVDIELENFEEETTDYSEDITPEDYEHFCADILNQNGWVAVVTQGSGDQGIDVVAEKDDFRLAIQCKKYSKPVGNKAVQEAYAGGAFYEANACAVVAPIEYTPSAIELADSLGVHLFHHDDLAGLSITSPDEYE